jgi:hypothetical protein
MASTMPRATPEVTPAQELDACNDTSVGSIEVVRSFGDAR